MIDFVRRALPYAEIIVGFQPTADTTACAYFTIPARLKALV
jgi:hypothetical protein